MKYNHKMNSPQAPNDTTAVAGGYKLLSPKESSKYQYENRVMIPVIYQITTATGKYIGSTRNIKLRLNAHMSSSYREDSLNYKARTKFYKELREGFVWEILETLDDTTTDKALHKRENLWIEIILPKWNATISRGSRIKDAEEVDLW